MGEFNPWFNTHYLKNPDHDIDTLHITSWPSTKEEKGESKMGMDCYIFEATNHRVFRDENWYSSGVVKERMYWRKNWDMVENWSFIPKNYESGAFIEIGSKELEEMIKVACTYRDYFGTYDTIPKLCELRDEVLGWEQDEIKDKKLFIEYDW